MDPFWASMIGAIFGSGAAIISAFVAGRYALKAARQGVQDSLETLRAQELRRQQVMSIYQLYGLRGGLTNNPSEETRRQFLVELNKIGALFASVSDTQQHLRNFHQNRSDANFLSLVRSAAKEAGMDITALSNDDIQSIFS